MIDPKEIKFTPTFEIGQIVYDITNGMKGVVISYNVDRRDVLYNVIFEDRDQRMCYKVQLSLNFIE